MLPGVALESEYSLNVGATKGLCHVKMTRNDHIVLTKTLRLFSRGDDRCFAYCFVLRRVIFSVESVWF